MLTLTWNLKPAEFVRWDSKALGLPLSGFDGPVFNSRFHWFNRFLCAFRNLMTLFLILDSVIPLLVIVRWKEIPNYDADFNRLYKRNDREPKPPYVSFAPRKFVVWATKFGNKILIGFDTFILKIFLSSIVQMRL